MSEEDESGAPVLAVTPDSDASGVGADEEDAGDEEDGTDEEGDEAVVAEAGVGSEGVTADAASGREGDDWGNWAVG